MAIKINLNIMKNVLRIENNNIRNEEKSSRLQNIKISKID